MKILLLIMKKLIILVLIAVMFTSCSEYLKVYNGKDPQAKYKLAWKLFEKGKYRKAEELFTQVDKFYKFKPNYQRLLYAHAMSLYNLKDYLSAGELFRKFTRLFPESTKAEEADFYILKSYYALSPKYSVDQSYTVRGIEEVDQFLKKYPFSKYKEDVNKMSKVLNEKLERKSFEIGKMYYDLDAYKSAMVAFNNFLVDFPGSVYKEDVLYNRYRAASNLALKSVESKKQKRLKTAIDYYNNFINKYPKSKYKKDMDRLYKKLQFQLTNKENKAV